MPTMVQRDGYDWQLLDVDERPSAVTLGATIAYGLLDETVDDYGTLRTFVGAMRAELARPVELVAGMVSVPQAMVEIGPDVVTLAVRGERDVVASAWRRLADFFTHPLPQEEFTPAPVNEFGWARDGQARCGLNAFVLSLLTAPVPRVPVQQVDQLRQHLDPARGQVRCVFFTDDEASVGLSAFATPRSSQGRASPPTPSRGQGRLEAGNIESSPGPVAFTLMVPRTWAGLAAGLVLRSHFAHSIFTVTGSAPGAGCVVYPLGADQWIHVVCEDMPAAPDRVRAVTATLATPVPDVLIENVINGMGTFGTAEHDRERRAHGLPDDTLPHAAEVRAAVAKALQTVHIPAESPAEEIPNHPQLITPLAPERGQRFHTWQSTSHLAGFGGTTTLTFGPRVLTMAYAERPNATETVDLERVSLVLEYGEGGLVILDDQMRTIEFDPSFFRRSARLRRLVDQRTAHAPRARLAAPTEDGGSLQARRQIRSSKRRLIFGLVILILTIALFVTMIVVQNASAVEPVTARVNQGAGVKLGDETKTTAQQFSITPAGTNASKITSNVEFCGGGLIEQKGISRNVHQVVAPADFSLYNAGGSAAQRATDGTGALQPATVRLGECTSGTLIFSMNGSTKGLRMSYQNAFGDDVVWYDR